MDLAGSLLIFSRLTIRLALFIKKVVTTPNVGGEYRMYYGKTTRITEPVSQNVLYNRPEPGDKPTSTSAKVLARSVRSHQVHHGRAESPGRHRRCRPIPLLFGEGVRASPPTTADLTPHKGTTITPGNAPPGCRSSLLPGGRSGDGATAAFNLAVVTKDVPPPQWL